LPAAGVEVATGVAAIGVDAAGVRLARHAVVHTGAVAALAERHLPEVAGLELLGDVDTPGALPAHEVAIGDEDRSRALEAARAAGQTV
jgi:hypothetical protein